MPLVPQGSQPLPIPSIAVAFSFRHRFHPPPRCHNASFHPHPSHVCHTPTSRPGLRDRGHRTKRSTSRGGGCGSIEHSFERIDSRCSSSAGSHPSGSAIQARNHFAGSDSATASPRCWDKWHSPRNESQHHPAPGESSDPEPSRHSGQPCSRGRPQPSSAGPFGAHGEPPATCATSFIAHRRQSKRRSCSQCRARSDRG